MKSEKLEFNEFCNFAVSIGKTNVKGEKLIATLNERTCPFSNPITKLLFKILPNRIKKTEEIYNKKQ